MDGVNQVAKQSKEEKLAYWRDHQCQWEASGLSRTAYCQGRKAQWVSSIAPQSTGSSLTFDISTPSRP